MQPTQLPVKTPPPLDAAIQPPPGAEQGTQPSHSTPEPATVALPHRHALRGQQQAPGWLTRQGGDSPQHASKRPAPEHPQAPPARRPQYQHPGLRAAASSQVLPQAARRDQEPGGVSAALSHFDLTWDELDGAQQERVRAAAGSMSGTNPDAFPEHLHAAILGALGQRREQPVLTDTERFINSSHPDYRAPSETAIYGGITINGAHRGPDGTLLHYLEQGLPALSALHAGNAMVGAPVLALSDVAAAMQENGVPLSYVRKVLKEKLGIATHVYRHVGVMDADGRSRLNRKQAYLLDRIDSKGLLLEIKSDSGATQCVAFRKDDDRWTLLDSVRGEKTASYLPSFYLLMEEATDFTAAWPQQGLSATGAAALPLDALPDAALLDPAQLAARLGLDASALHAVIPEWDGKVLRLWLAEENSDSSSRVQNVRAVKEVGGAEGAQLHKALLDYQWQRQYGKQAVPVGPAQPMRQAQAQLAVAANTPPRNFAQALALATDVWTHAQEMANGHFGDDRKKILADARMKWLDTMTLWLATVTNGDPAPWEAWPARGVVDEGKYWSVLADKDLQVSYDPGSVSDKIAAWKKAVVLSEEALDATKPRRFGPGEWMPPITVKGITGQGTKWRSEHTAVGKTWRTTTPFQAAGNRSGRTKEEAWPVALQRLAEFKVLGEQVKLNAMAEKKARDRPVADKLEPQLQAAMDGWRTDLNKAMALTGSDRAQALASARENWLRSVVRGGLSLGKRGLSPG